FLKPEKPTRYDGTPALEHFYRFAHEIKQYTHAYKVKATMLVYTVSHFLDGKAWRYYLNVLAKDEEDPHALKDILISLFNYCFPLDFKTKLRKKLHHFNQNDCSVCDYVQKLGMLLELVGICNDVDQVHHLWDGFNDEIEFYLLDHKLTPDTYPWEEI
ncbi:hypothetical protein K474DRAFT_1563906, partial [Panus rudis PR-1116 ss-1]